MRSVKKRQFVLKSSGRVRVETESPSTLVAGVHLFPLEPWGPLGEVGGSSTIVLSYCRIIVVGVGP